MNRFWQVITTKTIILSPGQWKLVAGVRIENTTGNILKISVCVFD